MSNLLRNTAFLAIYLFLNANQLLADCKQNPLSVTEGLEIPNLSQIFGEDPEIGLRKTIIRENLRGIWKGSSRWGDQFRLKILPNDDIKIDTDFNLSNGKKHKVHRHYRQCYVIKVDLQIDQAIYRCHQLESKYKRYYDTVYGKNYYEVKINFKRKMDKQSWRRNLKPYAVTTPEISIDPTRSSPRRMFILYRDEK